MEYILYNLSLFGKFDALRQTPHLQKLDLLARPGEIRRPNAIYSNIHLVFIWNQASSSKAYFPLGNLSFVRANIKK